MGTKFQFCKRQKVVEMTPVHLNTFTTIGQYIEDFFKGEK